MSTDAKRYYAVLGVDPSASVETIRVAFRRRAKELHPDAQSGDATAFILLKRAYDTLTNPVDRVAYDRFCGPEPRAEAPRRATVRRPMPPPPQVKAIRRSGVGIRRYVIAFLIMAAISLGGVEAMIMLTEAPPSIQTRTRGKRAEAPSAESASTPEPSLAPGSSKSGFWDATPPTPAHK